MIKTTRDRIASLRDRTALHPAAVPELVVLPVVDGNPAYLAWQRWRSLEGRDPGQVTPGALVVRHVIICG